MQILSRILVLAALVSATHAQAEPLKIDYTLAPRPTAQGEASTAVTIRIRGLQGEKSVRLQMAVWSPGDYHVMNHAKYVRDVRARQAEGSSRDEAARANVTHPDENTWLVETGGGDALEITYTLPNTPPGYFSENVRVERTYAFYNGPATYLYVAGHKSDPATLRVALPEGWTKTFTALPTVTGEPHAYSAPDFDTLADSPLVAGDMATREFSAVGRPHTIVFFNRHSGVNYDEFVPLLRKIVEEQNRMMGGPPYDRFGFLIDVGGRGGGLEHLNSFRVAWGRGFDPEAGAGFFAHEFFHLWNVKRIRPEVLGPFDYIQPPRTRNLWFSEGVTDYYGTMSVFRAGIGRRAQASPEESLYRGFASEIASLQGNPNRRRTTADEASLKVWEANNSSGFGGISYYDKGKLIGLCLDLRLRAITNGRAGLDEVMRDMLARYGPPKPGFPEDGIRDAVIRAGGEPMGPFYDRLCRSTEEMPFAECLAGVGLRLSGGGGSPYVITKDPNGDSRANAIRNGWLTGRRQEP
jgi:predicted metalloprotease with PDZ domain